ncbi:class I SAM-dependent methyltransferase [Lachnospiraceae bacterium ZAX-1]
MAYFDFMSDLHTRTKRDYVKRVNEADKAECAKVAKQFAYDYWDGDRNYGYGGYTYDGRWITAAQKIATHYGLKSGDKVLDVGCGKAYLLYELTQVVPGLQVYGLDSSDYAIQHAKEEVKPYLVHGKAQALPYQDKEFDLVISLATLHNLYLFDLESAVQEIQRVSKRNAYIMVESYRNEKEKTNLLYWQLTCECFFHTSEWEWLYRKWGYTGDYSFIFFV